MIKLSAILVIALAVVAFVASTSRGRIEQPTASQLNVLQMMMDRDFPAEQVIDFSLVYP